MVDVVITVSTDTSTVVYRSEVTDVYSICPSVIVYTKVLATVRVS